MFPVNLLALDSAQFDTTLKAGQGVQPPETGFGAAFGALLQAPAREGTPVATFPPGIDALTSWSAPGGEMLPQAGKGLPSPGPDELPALDPIAGDILAYAGTLDVPAEASSTRVAGAITPATATTTRSILPAPTAGMPGPGSEGLPTTAEAAPAQVSAAGQAVPEGGDRSSLVQHIRYLNPTPGAPAAQPLAGPEAFDTPGQAAAEPRLHAVPQTRVEVQEFARQITDARQASTAWSPAGAKSLPRGDGQDLKGTMPSAAVLTPLAPSNAAPAATPAPAAAAPLAWSGSSIDIAPGQAGWDEALGDRVTWMAGNKVRNAELRLNPADLGPLRVQISMDDGNASVTFSAQHPLTRDAIEQALPRLREMLADQGLSLQNASVNDHGPRQQQAGPGGENAAPAFVAAHDTDGGGMVDAENIVPVMRAPAGLVDVFA